MHTAPARSNPAPSPSFTLLHTSDWHLGHSLYGRKRHREAAAFLDWLADTLDSQSVDVLLVSGDIFDTAMPDTTAQRLYYDFLCRAFANPRRHVVITAGNHDSPAFLGAPGDLLGRLRVHVLAAGDTPEREVLTLRQPDGSALCVVCAVPYLRDRDLCPPETGADPEERDRKLLEALHAHYRQVAELAVAARGAEPVPLIVMGHLFAAGGVAEPGDGVRELYVGTLARVGSDLFPPEADYVALGHLHTPQMVNRQAHIRYSGAPLSMGPSERTAKSVCVVRFGTAKPEITVLPVPQTQRMERVRGDAEALETALRALVAESAAAAEGPHEAGQSIWVEVEYTGAEPPGALRSRLEAVTRGSGVDILRILDRRPAGPQVLHRATPAEQLEDLRPEDVFERRLDAADVPVAQRPELRRMHAELLLEALAHTGSAPQTGQDTQQGADHAHS